MNGERVSERVRETGRERLETDNDKVLPGEMKMNFVTKSVTTVHTPVFYRRRVTSVLIFAQSVQS